MEMMRWGILGTGTVASNLCAEIRRIKGAKLVGVASQNRKNAESFAQRLGVQNVLDSYGELLASKEVDAVYIATPNFLHVEHCVTAIEHGKAVLCEKPLAMSSKEGSEIIEASRTNNIFCMEAMWMRFHPYVQKLKRWMEEKRFGEFQNLHAELGWEKEARRIEDPSLGRGAVLDFGVYPFSLAHFLLGLPVDIELSVERHPSGVDKSFSATLHYDTGSAQLAASVVSKLSNSARITGSKGYAVLDPPLLSPKGLTFAATGKQPSSFSRLLKKTRGRIPILRYPQGLGMRREVEEVMRCVASGNIESQIMPHQDSLEVLTLVDAVRSCS